MTRRPLRSHAAVAFVAIAVGCADNHSPASTTPTETKVPEQFGVRSISPEEYSKQEKIGMAWVESNRQALPTSLEQYSQQPVFRRKYIYLAEPVDVRIKLWRTQLDGYAAPSSRLSVEQRALIGEVVANLEHYLRDGDAGRADVVKLQPRIDSVFPKVLARRVFTVLGPDDAPIVLRYRQRQVSLNEASMFAVFDVAWNAAAPLLGFSKKSETTAHPGMCACDCSSSSDWCAWRNPLYPSAFCLAGGSCQLNFFCGTLLLFTCDGLCFSL